ncbi:cyclic nucleotide-binding domain-containing protein [Candidatus Sumerlaeota bacterium]|nr:cyclic nucleotide-binding domain-containing protein [Candidatus Sumerlaeota bacterium]
MSPKPPARQRTPVILCAVGDATDRERLRRDLTAVCGTLLPFEIVGGGGELLARLDQLVGEGKVAAVIVVAESLPDTTGSALLTRIQEHPAGQRSQRVLLAERAPTSGAWNRCLEGQWAQGDLAACIRALFTQHLVTHDIGRINDFTDLIDYQLIGRTLARVSQQCAELGAGLRTMFSREMMSDEELEEVLLAEINRAFNNPVPRTVPPGTVLLRQGQRVDEILIRISGRVQLSRREGEQEKIFHIRTVGRIIGLLALTQRHEAFYTCKALSETRVISLPLDRLQAVLASDPQFTSTFVSVLIRSLVTRNRKAVALELEVESLNDTLEAERDHLREALAELERAHLRLTESEKMAQLGQLSAGITHELNNPIAAIRRAADHVAEDIASLVRSLPHGDELCRMLEAAMQSAPRPTREARALRRDLAEQLGDESLARRLVEIGVTSAEELSALCGELTPHQCEERLSALEQQHRLGISLRNIQTSAERVAGLVKSLRSYARTDGAMVADVDVHEGIEDTLGIFSHALRGVEVERRYGDLPRITCMVGEINQIWTNLISNALEAMENQGHLTIETDVPDAGHVRVRLIDSGPGIAPENIGRIFDLNFTTRTGAAQFGLGIGLAICREIVTRHGGSITVESVPGRTRFTVTLPLNPPQFPQERDR